MSSVLIYADAHAKKYFLPLSMMMSPLMTIASLVYSLLFYSYK